LHKEQHGGTVNVAKLPGYCVAAAALPPHHDPPPLLNESSERESWHADNHDPFFNTIGH
jgi:hypothetical protein